MEISNLSDAEFKTLLIRMLKELSEDLNSCLLALALLSDTSVSPCVPLVPFKLLPQCWSPEGVSLCNPVVGPLWGHAWESYSFCAAPTPTGFTARSYGDFYSWHWNLGLSGLVCGWDSFLPRYPSWFLSITCGCGTSLSCVSNPPSPLNQCDLFNPLVVVLPYNPIFDSFEW